MSSAATEPGSGGEAGWSSAAFAAIARWLHAEAGLVFPRARQAAVEGSLRRVMSGARLRDPDDLRVALLRGGAVVDAVIAELTIGETYFFREPRQLEVIRETAFPDVAGRDGAARPFRAWSAGCASGEEPYTLAIMLREIGWTGPARILGTDLASARLAAARRGRYTRWSFRGVPESLVERYFVAERKHYVIDAGVRAAVEFRVLNLAEDAYPSAASGVDAMDVILCRNVLIYFDAETVRRVAGRLLDSLAEDGWLFLGASDPMIGGIVPCETVVTPAGLAYRRPRAGAAAFTLRDGGLVTDTPAAWQAPRGGDPAGGGVVLEGDPLDATFRVGPTADGAGSVASDIEPAPSAAAGEPVVVGAAPTAVAARAEGDREASGELDDEAAAVGHVRSLANQGRLAEADAACVVALERHAGSAELEYLRAVILREAGHDAAALTALRRALYLDRRLAVAHLLLGELLARGGEREGSARSFRNAEALLAALPPDALVPASDGAPAVRLLHIARTRAAAVGGGA